MGNTASIFISNCATGCFVYASIVYNGSTGFVSGKFIQIRHNGAVTWPVPVRLRSSCLVKIAYFPFDYQRCFVRFGSWIYSHDFMDYTIRPDAVSVDLTTYINNSEWELLSMTMEKDTKRRARSDKSHPFLTMTIYLRRNTFFYLFNIIVPCIMLSMLTLMTFWLPPTSGEKVTLGLSVFLAFSMFMLLIAEEVPASSDAVPIIGIYLCVVMTMTSLSVILAVLVTNLHYRGTKLRSAPRWFARLFIRFLAVPMCVSRDIELLATTIILPDHCRFFLIHNKFDFPTCNINAYNKYNRAMTGGLKPNSPTKSSRVRTPPKNKSSSKTGARLDESQRYVFDHQDPQRLWSSRSYTSGKRSHIGSQKRNERMPASTLQNTKVDETKYDFLTADAIVTSDEFLESCDDSDTELEGREKREKTNDSTDLHSHCSLQQLCDSSSTFPRRKTVSPFMDKIFPTNTNRKPRSRCFKRDSVYKKPITLSLSDVCHTKKTTTTNENACFNSEEGRSGGSSGSGGVQVVTVDLTPAGTTIDKSFQLMSLTPPSSFLNTRTSPTQQRRKLIKTMQHYNETKDDSDKVLAPSHLLRHQNVESCDDMTSSSQNDLCLSSETSEQHRKNLFKRHKNNNSHKENINYVAIPGSSHPPVHDSSLSMDDLRLQDHSIRHRKFSPDNPRSKNYSKKRRNKIITNLSSSCTVFNTNIPFESQAVSRHQHHCLSQSSNHSQPNHLSPSFPNSLVVSQTTDYNKYQSPAKRWALPVHTIKPEVTEDTFCQCSESQEDVWVPYDRNDNSDDVWCLRDYFHHDNNTDYSPSYKDYSECEDDTSAPLLSPVTDYHSNNAAHNNNYSHDHSPSASVHRAAKKQNSLTQQSVERFMDDRSRLILAKARLVMAEWQTIASVIDRLLFLVALFATIFAYVFLLVVVPGDHNLDSFNMSQTLPTSTGRYDWLSST